MYFLSTHMTRAPSKLSRIPFRSSLTRLFPQTPTLSTTAPRLQGSRSAGYSILSRVACSSWWTSCSTRLCVGLSTTKVSRPYSCPRPPHDSTSHTEAYLVRHVDGQETCLPYSQRDIAGEAHPFTDRF